MLIVQLIRIAVDHINNGVILEILRRSPDLEEQDLSSLRRMLTDAGPVSTMQGAFLGEMKMGYKRFTEALDGRMTPRMLSLVAGDDSMDVQAGPIDLWLYRPYGLWETRGFLDAYVGLIDELGKPRFERTRAFTLDPKQMPRGRGLFYSLAIPNLALGVLRADLTDASRICGRTAVALESYARARGNYPQTLEALVPTYLDRLPIDPFSGHPIEYRREGNGYVLRSQGDDPKFDVGLRDYDKVVDWRITR
jgi:hypothetical protein